MRPAITTKQSLLATLALTLACFLVAGEKALAFPMSEPSIPEVAGKADTIAKVRVEKTAQLDKAPTWAGEQADKSSVWYQAELHTIHVLTGRGLPDRFTMQYELGFDRPPIESVEAGKCYIIFLKVTGGRYTFADPLRSKVLADPNVPRPGEEVSGPSPLIAHLSTSLRSSDRKVVLASLMALEGFAPKSVQKSYLEPLLSSEDRMIVLQTLRTLLRLGYFEHLKQAISIAWNPPPDLPGDGYTLSAGGAVMLYGNVLMCQEIERIKDQEVLPELISAMESPNPALRRAASYALRQGKVRSAAPVFVKGLDDSDANTRYNCVMALAEIAQDENMYRWAPATDIFAKDEAPYIRAWKDWWEKQGKGRKW
jgi:hypothetical protein